MPARVSQTPLRALFFALATALSACSPQPVSSDPDLAALVDRIGWAELRRMPEQADIMGVSTEAFGGNYSALLNDRAMAATERTRAMRLDFLREIELIDPATLGPDALRTHESLRWLFESMASVDGYGYGYTGLGWTAPYVVTFADGAYSDLVKFMTLHAPVRSRADAQAWLARLELMDDAMRDERRRLEVDLRAGVTPPTGVLRRTLDRVRQLTPANAREHPLVAFFVEALAQTPDIPEEELTRLAGKAADLVGGSIRNEYAELDALLEQALKGAPEEPGVWRLKEGEAYYAAALRLYTSTPLTAKQLHDEGERLVASISADLEPLLLEMGLAEGSVGARLQTLSVDPQHLYPDTPEGRAALLADVQARIKWAEDALARVSTTAPRGKVALREAAHITQDSAPGAFYKPAALDGSRPAVYNLKLRSTADFPKWTLPTLTFHESLPGHHLASALAMERPDEPMLEKLVALPGYSEGWATYAEDLADELGAYTDDKLGRIGYLRSLLLRAARLVVDTGIHAQRWSRDEAIGYLERTTGMGRIEAEYEVDRYTIWPGQACAYMAGRQIIRRLRADAQRELKGAFDLKAFHQVILGPGPRPLPVVEADVRDWVAAQRPAPVQQ